MMKQKKRSLFKFIVVVFVIIMLKTNALALIWANETEGSVIPPGNKSNSMRSYVISGAGHFLQSYSSMLTFLNKIERSELDGLNYAEIQSDLDSAIEYMTEVKTAYAEITREADMSTYNQEVIAKLLIFDYTAYEKANSLNHGIFTDVAFYLKKGDVKGIYHKLLSDIEGILNILAIIKEKVDVNVFPGVSDLHRMNQYYSQSLLFGQYVAEVFIEIKK
ncbi:hypothetical protein ACFLRB_03235 [Acidobacteriota bacterium]